MPTLKAVLCAALSTCVLLGSAPAEARFGKSSSSSSKSSSNSSSSSGGNSSSRSSRSERASSTSSSSHHEREERPRVHRATPIGLEHEDRGSDAPRRRRSRVVVRSPLVDFIVAGAIVTAVPVVRHLGTRTRPRLVKEERYEPVPLHVRLGVQGGRFRDGGALGLFMAMEGRRLGLDTRITGLGLEAEDGSHDIDRITLLGAHVTAALWAGKRGRMRLEAGVASAHAPDIIFVGPSLGASVEACIGRSPVDLEARIHATPFPHRQVDAQAGMALHLGAFNMRGGWRALYLNDAGHVDGVEHEEGLAGPYFGLGLTF